MFKKKKKCALGIDLGGTKINIGLVDEEGEILERTLVHTDVEGGAEAVIGQIMNTGNELLSEGQYTLETVGIGLAGQIEKNTGNVLFAPNLKWRDVAIKKQLQETWKVPVAVLNDVRAAAYAEWQLGAGKGCNDLVCLFVGTGIGGGIVTDGKLLTGDTNSAGEVGHMVIHFNGHLCTCGNRGCFEAYASGWALAARAREKIVANPKKGSTILDLSDQTIEKVSGFQVEKAYRQNDPLAIEIVEEFTAALIAGSVSLVNVLNPKRLVFGGGVIKGLGDLLKPVHEGIKKQALKSATRQLEVVQAQLLTDAGVVGAALYAYRHKDK